MLRKLVAFVAGVMMISACSDNANHPTTTTTEVRPTTTTIAPTTTTSTTVVVRQAAANRGVRYRGPIDDSIWSKLSWCEAGGRPDAVSRNGRYFGAFQFSLATWHGIGMTGNPIDYPYDVQLEAAKRLQARSGWGQWPVCSRKLGLR